MIPSSLYGVICVHITFMLQTFFLQNLWCLWLKIKKLVVERFVNFLLWLFTKGQSNSRPRTQGIQDIQAPLTTEPI